MSSPTISPSATAIIWRNRARPRLAFLQVHRLVGAIHDRFRVVVGGDDADADRDAQRQRRALVGEVAGGDSLDQPGRGLGGDRLVGMLEEDTEFVAAQPRDAIAAAHAADQHLGDADQRFVAGLVPVAVVDAFRPSISTNSIAPWSP